MDTEAGGGIGPDEVRADPSTPSLALVPVTAPPPPVSTGLAAVVERGTRIGFGVIDLGVRALRGTQVRPTRPDDTETHGVTLVVGAMVGLTLAAQERALGFVSAVLPHSAPRTSATARPRATTFRIRPLDVWLQHWNARARQEQERNRAEAASVLRAAVQDGVESVLRNLDLAAIVESIPIADIVNRIDVEDLMSNIDFASLVRQAMEGMDIAGTIRESMQGMTGEAVDTVRAQTMSLDGFVARKVDRVLFRGRTRDVSLDSAATEEPS